MKYVSKNQLRKESKLLQNKIKLLVGDADDTTLNKKDLDDLDEEYDLIVSAIANNYRANIIEILEEKFREHGISYKLTNNIEVIFINDINKKSKAVINILYEYSHHIRVEIDNGLYIAARHI